MSRFQIRLHVQTCGHPESPSPICHPGHLPRRNEIGLTGQGACQLPGQSHHSLSCYLRLGKEMQPATEKPGASPETQRMMSSSKTGLGPAAPPTNALGNRVQSLHHFLQGHLFMSQPEPHSPQRRTVLQPRLPLHQRCFGGGEALGRGPAAPPARDWSRAPPRGRVGGLLGGSGSGARPASLRSHLGTQRAHPRAASKAFHKCTPGCSQPGPPARTRGSLDSPARAPPRRPGRSTSAPRGHLGAARIGATRRDLSPQPGPPLQPQVSAPSPEWSGEPRGRGYGACPPLPPAAPGQVQRPQQPGARSPRRRMSPAPPSASGSVGSRWSGGRRLPKDARRRREARAQAPAGHAWHEATQCILHPAPCRSQPCVCPGPAPLPWEAQEPCVRRDPDWGLRTGADLTEGPFEEQVPGPVSGLGNSSGQRMSTQGVPTSQLGGGLERKVASSQGLVDSRCPAALRPSVLLRLTTVPFIQGSHSLALSFLPLCALEHLALGHFRGQAANTTASWLSLPASVPGCLLERSGCHFEGVL